VKYLLSIYPHTFVDAVEIREDIISIAHTYFFVPHDKRLTIIPDDAYRFVYHNAKQSKEKYDVILVDVYDQNGLAPSVDKADFFSSCKLLLDQDGILVVNMWAASGHHIKQYLELLHLTFNSKPFCLPVPERGNVIVFVTNNAVTGQTFKHLKKQASQLEQQFTLPFSRYLQDIVKHNTKGWLSRFFNN
jgi:spermidine synthase